MGTFSFNIVHLFSLILTMDFDYVVKENGTCVIKGKVIYLEHKPGLGWHSPLLGWG